MEYTRAVPFGVVPSSPWGLSLLPWGGGAKCSDYREYSEKSPVAPSDGAVGDFFAALHRLYATYWNMKMKWHRLPAITKRWKISWEPKNLWRALNNGSFSA